MHHTMFFGPPPRKRTWSIKHPSGVTFMRDTFEEAIETAFDLASRMRDSGARHYTCRVFKTTLHG